MTDPDRECFTDFALQEYTQGRLDAEVRTEVEAHVQGCAECREALRAFEAETTLLREALRPASGAAPEPPAFADEHLALYLAGALEADERIALETALSRHPALLARLDHLAHEAMAVRDRVDTELLAAGPQAPLGEILRMPKRFSRPATVIPQRRAGGGQAG